METVEFEKSHIAKIEYGPASKTLNVFFRGKGAYQYSHIEPDMFADFARSEHPGKFYHAHIRGRSEFEGKNLSD